MCVGDARVQNGHGGLAGERPEATEPRGEAHWGAEAASGLGMLQRSRVPAEATAQSPGRGVEDRRQGPQGAWEQRVAQEARSQRCQLLPAVESRSRSGRPWGGYLLTAASAGRLVGRELLLHVGGLVHFLGVEGQAAERAQGGWHLQARLEALPTEPAGRARPEFFGLDHTVWLQRARDPA